jgi:hypothetical protein
MNDPFLEKDWELLCRRLQHRCAEHFGLRVPCLADSFDRQANQFCQLNAPHGYRDLLERVRSAATLAGAWREQCKRKEEGGAKASDIVQEACDESFRASDPPASTTAAI